MSAEESWYQTVENRVEDLERKVARLQKNDSEDRDWVKRECEYMRSLLWRPNPRLEALDKWVTRFGLLALSQGWEWKPPGTEGRWVKKGAKKA